MDNEQLKKLLEAQKYLIEAIKLQYDLITELKNYIFKRDERLFKLLKKLANKEIWEK
jgi:hypothetical protein